MTISTCTTRLRTERQRRSVPARQREESATRTTRRCTRGHRSSERTTDRWPSRGLCVWWSASAGLPLGRVRMLAIASNRSRLPARDVRSSRWRTRRQRTIPVVRGHWSVLCAFRWWACALARLPVSHATAGKTSAEPFGVAELEHTIDRADSDRGVWRARETGSNRTLHPTPCRPSDGTGLSVGALPATLTKS